MTRRMTVSMLAVLLFACAGNLVRADDIATLPLGNPTRAYLLGSGEAGQVLATGSAGGGDAATVAAMPVTLETLAADLAKADVVIIGEHHTDIEGHRMQWKVLEALAATGRPFALGMEFFEVTDDEALAAFIAGTDELPAMLEKTGWYAGGAYNFEYYRPMVEMSRVHKAPVYGLNVPREWVRTVSRQGIDSLTADQRSAIGELGEVDVRHKYVVNQMMGGMGAAMPQMFDGMYRGQTAWDAAMATSIMRACAQHKNDGTPRTLVAIVGMGHMAHGLGIPARLAAMDPSLVVRTFAPVQAAKPADDAQVHPGFERKETAIFSLGYADYVHILPDRGDAEEYPQVGVRVGLPPGTSGPLKVLSVTPGGIAERAGLRKDDLVKSIGSASPATGSEAGALLSMLRWNERVEWQISRPGVGEMMLQMLVVPATDAEGNWLKSTAASALMDTFDPLSERSYSQVKGMKPAGAHARLVTFRNRATRIDVLREGVLVESWNLDEQGRPVLGLFATPSSDGAVRVVITRDESGRVMGVKRTDRDGKEIGGAGDATK